MKTKPIPLTMSRGINIFVKLNLISLILYLSACYATLKFPSVDSAPVLSQGSAIFRDDFPFEISPLTPDPSTVIPPARAGCSVLLLPVSPQAFELKYYLLKNAIRFIKLQTYILYQDPVSKKVVEILKDKQNQGVKVQLIADCYTKFVPKDRVLYYQMEKSGLELLGFEPIYFSTLNNPQYLIDIDEINMRFHEKYWIVDDYVAITGGTNISQEYAQYQNKPRLMWRDQDVLLMGPVVNDFTRAFDENYQYFWEKQLNRPPLINPQWYQLKLNKLEKFVPEKTQPIIWEKGHPRIQLKHFDDEDVLVRFIRHRPRLKETYVHQAYLHLIRTARKKILIENSYLLLDQAQMQAFLESARHGVEIVIITNCEKTNDVTGLQPLTRSQYLPLLEAGIKIYEWQGIIPGKGSLHSKYAVFDDEIVVIGSYNFDPRSTFLNSEDIVVLYSPKIAHALTKYTELNDLPFCQQVSQAQAKKWANPNLFTKIWHSLALLFKNWW